MASSMSCGHDDLRLVQTVEDDVVDHGIETLPHAVSQHIRIPSGKYPSPSKIRRPDGVVDIVVDIGDLIRESGRCCPSRVDGLPGCPVVQDPVPHLPGQVQSLSLLLQHLHHPDALLIVGKARPDRSHSKSHSPECPKGVWPRSWPRAMASVRLSFSRRALAMVLAIWDDLQGVGQPGPVMVSLRRQEHLGLML